MVQQYTDIAVSLLVFMGMVLVGLLRLGKVATMIFMLKVLELTTVHLLVPMMLL